LSGTLRVRNFQKTNPSGYYGSLGAEADDQSYFDQRLRIGGKIAVADNVSGTFRMDVSEGAWGDGFNNGTGGWASAAENNEIGVDRAHMDFTKGMFSIRAGQYFNGVGNYTVWDHQATGIVAKVDVEPVKIMLEYAKMDEGGGLTDEEGDSDAVPPVESTEDQDFMGLNVGFGTDVVSGNVYYATIQDQDDDGDSPYAIGVQATTSLGMVNLNGSLDIFGGEVGDSDYVGTQLFLDGNAAVTDKATVGASLVYAMGTDEDDEVQRTAITAGGESFTPFGFRGDLMYYFYPVGSLYGGSGGGQFDPAGVSGGAMGGALYVDFTIIEPLVAHAVVSTVSPQEDENTELNSVTAFVVSLDYQLMDGVKLNAGYAASTPDYDDDTSDETTSVFVTQVQIGF
jgi:hypothetical protein